MSIAKAISSAYLPIAGVMIPDDMYQVLIVESQKIGMFGHGFTYSGHPVAAAVAVKTLEITGATGSSSRRRRTSRSSRSG